MTLKQAVNGQYTFHVSHQQNYICLDFTGDNVSVQIDDNACSIDKALLQTMDFYLVDEMSVLRTPESQVIEKYFSYLGTKNRFCVDIGALDGSSFSSSFDLFEKGWNGMMIECDSRAFAKLAQLYKNRDDLHLVKTKATPLNIVSLLQSFGVPRQFDFLDLDIDGYDYFVLEQILKYYRPNLISVEINESIPPPFKFTIKYDPQFTWKGSGDHFYGQSICQLYQLCQEHNYLLVELSGYINAYLIPAEISLWPGLMPEEAYQKGYLNLPRPYQNQNMEALLSMTSQEGVYFLHQLFNQHQGKYVLEI